MTKIWYAKTNSHQGLIIEEETGRNVAVSYDVADAKLLAAAPELLEALKSLLDVCHCTNGCTYNDASCASNVARWAIEKADGE